MFCDVYLTLVIVEDDSELHYHFAVQSSPHVIKLLQAIIQHSIECMKLNPAMMSYSLLACLRLLRVNMHELITHERDLNKCFESAHLGMCNTCMTMSVSVADSYTQISRPLPLPCVNCCKDLWMTIRWSCRVCALKYVKRQLMCW